MSRYTRRRFLMSAATVAGAASAAALGGRPAMASGFALPLGLQLYCVRELLAIDFAGTLKQLYALGYREVEAAGFFGRSPQEVRAAMDAAGLRLVGAHYASSDLSKNFDEILAFGQALEIEYLICSFPGFRHAESASGEGKRREFALDDYRWNADRFNEWGHKAKAAGIQFGYHNHTAEFRPQGGVVPLDEMMRLTDPALVTFELDCGWVAVGGGDPVRYLQTYPERISLIHIKDFKPTAVPASPEHVPPAAELGRGTVDFPKLLAAASAAKVRHCFVEQEGFNLPPLESLRVDAAYMHRVKLSSR